MVTVMAIRRFCFDCEAAQTSNQYFIDKIMAEEKERPCPGAPKSANPRAETVERYEAAVSEWKRGLDSRVQERVRATAKDPLLAKILCASAVCDGELVNWSAMHGLTVEQMLTEFFCFVSENCDEQTVFSGFCITIYDLPLLLTGARIHGVDIPAFFPTYRRHWWGNVVDIQHIIPSSKPFLSFNDAAHYHGLSGKTTMWKRTPMTGGRVQDALEAGEHDLILEYCDSDVINEWGLLSMCAPEDGSGAETTSDQIRTVMRSGLSDEQKIMTINNIIGE